MPIPIRLVNNTDSNSGIENTFQNPPVIGAKAKIALKSVNVKFTNDVYNQDFVVDDTNSIVNLDINGESHNIVLVNGTYNRQKFIQMLSQECNSDFVNTDAPIGLDIDCEVTDSGKFKLKVTASPVSKQDTNTEWEAPTGTWTRTGSNFSFTNGSGNGRFISRFTAPRNSGALYFDLSGYVSGANENIYFGLIDTAQATKTFNQGDFLIGGGIQGTDMVTIENGVVTTTGKTVSNTDFQVNMIYFNNSLVVEADNNTEVVIDIPSRDVHYRWAVYIPDNGFDFDCEDLEAQTSDQTTNCTFELDVANTTLQQYLGLGGDKLTGSGNPATGISDKVMEGDTDTDDIIVRLDAPTLVGFDGLSGQKASILEIIPQFQQTGNNSLYTPNELTPIPVNNTTAFNLSRLRVSFVRQQGARPLQIDKNSCVNLILYDSDDVNY